MKISIPLLLLCALSLLLGLSFPANNPCVITRAAYDIGSGSSRLKIARVDKCKYKIKKVLAEKRISVKYKRDLSSSKTGKFSESIMTKGLNAFKELDRLADKFKPDETIAVATAAFREAKNSPSYKEKIKKATGLNINIISQKAEARLGFAGATKLAKDPFNDLVVWDIGGGSMQITAVNKNKKFDIYLGEMAAVPFKDLVIEKIQKKSVKDIQTPNPMSLEESQMAVNEAHLFAQKNIPDSIKLKLASGVQIIGIGGVHYYSIRGQTNADKSYTYKQVLKAIDKRSRLTDKQLDANFAATEVSNLALIAGFMRALGIQKVTTGNVNLTDGLLIAPEVLNIK